MQHKAKAAHTDRCQKEKGKRGLERDSVRVCLLLMCR